MRRPQRYDVSVFLNCPFDDSYRPLLHAAIFAIQDCGFLARTALEDVGSGETRLDKIARIIGESRFSMMNLRKSLMADQFRFRPAGFCTATY